MKYVIIIEPTGTGFSAYSPDLDGCVAIGGSRSEVQQNMTAAISVHIEILRESGQEIPQPRSSAAVVEVAA
jgi:predicted RNase H-like HicB family nuclease